MTNILRRLWPRRRATDRITMGVLPVEVQRPIPLTTPRKEGGAWYGYWDRKESVWCWGDQPHPEPEDTHWLPADVQVLPARCCPPEVQP